MRFLRGVVAGAALCFLLSACVERALHQPNEEEFVGLYLPDDAKESGIRPDSALRIETRGRCKLVDFPVASYASGSTTPELRYYSQEATWNFSTDGSECNLAIFLRSDSIRDQSDITLRILSNRGFLEAKIPYRVSQEGEDVEDDILIFAQHPLPSK